MAIAMGYYEMTDNNSLVVRAEYLAILDNNNNLRIILHHSSCRIADKPN